MEMEINFLTEHLNTLPRVLVEVIKSRLDIVLGQPALDDPVCDGEFDMMTSRGYLPTSTIL